MVDFLNQNSGAVQGLSTIILVFITGFYAWQTYRTNKLIYRQVASNIVVTVKSIQTNLVSKGFIEDVKEGIKRSAGYTYNVTFVITYYATNKSASPGAIEKPTLILKSKLDKHIIRLDNKGKKVYIPFIMKSGGSAADALAAKELASKQSVLDETVFLQAGERKNLQDTFTKNIEADKVTKEDRKLIEHRNQYEYSLEYFNDKEELVNLPISPGKIINMNKSS